MRLALYYIADDPANPKYHNEIEYLSTVGRVIIVSCGQKNSLQFKNNPHVKTLVISTPSPLINKLTAYWSKTCYLICKSSTSLNDIGFPVRNKYSTSPFVRRIINSGWHLKYNRYVRRILPSYETLFFLPFILISITQKVRNRHKNNQHRILIHDSIFLRLFRFLPFIAYCRNSRFKTIANVKSWDNVFYSHFVDSADGYLVWSQAMWLHIKKYHMTRTNNFHVWGPRLFHGFSQALDGASIKEHSSINIFNIGYAAAFPDSFMAHQEVRLITRIADELAAHEPIAKILFRPYPIVDCFVYSALYEHPSVIVADIIGPNVDRFDDGTESIKFGSNSERISFLSRCSFFLSLATSFTFEAALYGLPVYQYYLPKHKRTKSDERSIFELIDISDHILLYFKSCLPIISDVSQLIALVSQCQQGVSNTSSALLRKAGFPGAHTTWDFGSSKLRSDLKI